MRERRELDVTPLLEGARDEKDEKGREEKRLCCEKRDTSPSLAIAKA
jgi:hypothetical protein